MRLRYDTLDVFTETRFGGNQLAVVHDADALSGEQMQTVAREFNYSETVFLLAPQTVEATARVRIFTPGTELPFAGHPTVGTAVLLVLGERGERDGSAVTVRLEAPVGLLTVRVTGDGADRRAGMFTAPRLPREAEPPPDPAEIAEALGLAVDRIGFGAHVPRAFDAGMAFNFVPVTGRDALAACKVVQPAWADTFSGRSIKNVFAYCRAGDGEPVRYHARMFAPDFGIEEDPATGSAVAAFSGQVAASEQLADGVHELPVEQGRDMGRPSAIHLTLEMADGAVRSARVGGGAVRICEGWISL